MNFKIICFYLLIFTFIISSYRGYGQQHQPVKYADKPLFRDPIYDGAADPTLIWNQREKKWFMFYTNRRAKDTVEGGVAWVHGTRIGIAVSSNQGRTWKYLDTADIAYRPDTGYTFWAPEVIAYKGLYHMYVTYVPGIFKDWNHPRLIIHFTSKNLINWKYIGTLKLINDHVIDPCIIRLPNGKWRMWYNNEPDHKSIYYADSPDLYTWIDGKKAINDQPGEGPKAFYWKGTYWMITDVWQGLAVYSSKDLLRWKRQQGNLVETPGKGKDDGAAGDHCDVVVSSNGKAYLFYFTQPGRSALAPKGSQYDRQRSSIQVAELMEKNGTLYCDRDQPTLINLIP
ncbi:family 43 glycosylhydrolase [Mucilaginibacter sp. L196]|uniref:family 43 glycosylhydrolase n=1 Tax=Mucilaginibacter sp. L196 TaxID=1641870 RepID=UPI00131C839F|nr:family 43 glycosylhydrolase [Mucilaginibacter sp. L196]